MCTSDRLSPQTIAKQIKQHKHVHGHKSPMPTLQILLKIWLSFWTTWDQWTRVVYCPLVLAEADPTQTKEGWEPGGKALGLQHGPDSTEMPFDIFPSYIPYAWVNMVWHPEAHFISRGPQMGHLYGGYLGSDGQQRSKQWDRCGF